jgi:hypothetical protein
MVLTTSRSRAVAARLFANAIAAGRRTSACQDESRYSRSTRRVSSQVVQHGWWFVAEKAATIAGAARSDQEGSHYSPFPQSLPDHRDATRWFIMRGKDRLMDNLPPFDCRCYAPPPAGRSFSLRHHLPFDTPAATRGSGRLSASPSHNGVPSSANCSCSDQRRSRRPPGRNLGLIPQRNGLEPAKSLFFQAKSARPAHSRRASV